MADEVPVPGNGRLTPLDPTDPTVRTTQLVDRAVDAFREVMETRLAGMDRATELVAQSLRAFRAEADISEQRGRAATTSEIAALAALLDTRLGAMDKATELLAATVGRVPSETDKAVASLRELLSERIDGMDTATKLLAANVNTIPSDIEKSAAGLKSIIETRLAGMDEATKLLATNVDKVPYAILQEAGNLKALIMSKIDDVAHVADEKFKSVESTFASNALALTAALAAQKEAAAEQNKSNTLAIDRANSTTKETIAANAQQTMTGQQSLVQTLQDLKERVVRIESAGVGAEHATDAGRYDRTFAQTAQTEAATRARALVSSVIAGVAALVAVIALIALFVKK